MIWRLPARQEKLVEQQRKEDKNNNGTIERRTRRNTHIRDDPMERTFRVSETVLSRSELTEILRRAWHHVIEQTKDNSTSRFRVDRDVELYRERWAYHQNFSKGMQSLKNYGAHEYIRPVYKDRFVVSCGGRDEGMEAPTEAILLLKQRL
jgi:hypothetical protein